MGTSEFTLKPIGLFLSNQVEPYEAGRQPDSHHSNGAIDLFPGHNFEQALQGLEGCPRIWIIFLFHHNSHWNPMVLPPRGQSSKIGVFATRSPYRPNGIGISCVELLGIQGLTIHVAGADILNGSPILDIKPYVAYADAYPGVEPLWLGENQKHEVLFSILAQEQLVYLEGRGVSQFRGFLLRQLEYEPSNKKKKRVRRIGDKHVIAYRTWRAEFTLQNKIVTIGRLFSGYSAEELNHSDDPYGDKLTHQNFALKYPET